MEPRRKLSPSGISTFLKSPKAYYFRYIAKLEPIQQSVGTFDDAKVCGSLWSSFVDRFYNGVDEKTNTTKTLADWYEQTDGWCPEKNRDKLTRALEAWSANYYQMFLPDDGTRGKGKSELFLENDRFLGYLDGLSDDGVIHEVKSTSRSPQLAGQIWKVQNSLQVRLYSVLAKATGSMIEFAFKDSPYAIYRGPTVYITEEQRNGWEQELNHLADYIVSLGDDEHNYACNPDSCCLVTRGVTSLCAYDALCEMGLSDLTKVGYKEKTNRR